MDGEQKLAKRARSGDLSALAELFQNNYSFLVKYLIKITLHPETAEDIAQETMLRAMEKIKLFDGKAKFSTWLISIATRLYIDNRRRKARERKWLETEGQEQAGRYLKWKLEAGGGEWTDVLEALGKLNEETRLAVVLKHYYGYSQREIAEMTDVPEGTVKSRIHNGIVRLRKELTEDERENEPEGHKYQTTGDGRRGEALHSPG